MKSVLQKDEDKILTFIGHAMLYFIVHEHSLASWALHFPVQILLPQVKIYLLAS